VVATAVGLYYAFFGDLWSASVWWDVAFLAFCLVPAVFALVFLAAPFWRSRALLLVAAAFGLLAFVLTRADYGAAANFAKLGAMTAAGFWFLGYFERLAWVVVVAAIVPLVDSYSVWRGPTKNILEHRQEVFTALSFAFPVPGETGTAQLGLPDLLFFAVYLAACARWGLRIGWTALAMALSFGATMALAIWLDVAGLPALPFLSLAFLAVNADLIWAGLRAERGGGPEAEAEEPS
jgi:hypothetical protein